VKAQRPFSTWSTSAGDVGTYLLRVSAGFASETETVTVTASSASGSVPSSAIHRWKLDDVGTATATDYIGSADGTINGGSWVSGTWTGGYALDGDSSNPDELPEQETWLSNMDTGFALAHTFQASGDGYIFGTRLGNKNSIWGGFGTDFDPSNKNAVYQFTTRNGPGGANTNQTNGTYLDGNKHRVLITGSDAHPDNIEIYVDGTADGFNERDDSGHTAVTGGDRAWDLFSRNGTGGGNDGIMDNFILWDRELTASEAQADYDNQPWS